MQFLIEPIHVVSVGQQLNEEPLSFKINYLGDTIPIRYRQHTHTYEHILKLIMIYYIIN